eukprot:TRINITY_DN162_c0_g2_i2.p1 TRINITY_DN162_c0_g2~~TRINITY_DN162_c0_g2_i2.p1  ORF type:complete len:192 (-),score=58.96 TRINITY_DN162_c0_g2_i2:33-608(-)
MSIRKVALVAKWGNKEYPMEMEDSSTLEEMKMCLYSLTKVNPKRQKIVGLYKGKAEDNNTLAELAIVSNKKFMMIGTIEEEILKEPKPEDIADVLNDFDIDYFMNPEEAKNSLENQKNLEKIGKENEIIFMNAPRPGRKLLVLDLDYTIFDMKTETDDWSVLKRPHLDDFMTKVYPKYDVVGESKYRGNFD